MITIDGDHSCVTVVTLYRIAPADRLRMLGALDEYHHHAVLGHPGFIRAAVHVSERSDVVMVYAQWHDRALYDAFSSDADAHRAAGALSEFRVESWVMDVALETTREDDLA